MTWYWISYFIHIVGPLFEIIKYDGQENVRLTLDARPDRDEKWLNVIVRKAE